jgi:protein-L-isoaspartate O-methyltransferase
MDFEICRALLRGSYELAERTLARAAIRTGDNVLEIGAGIGIVSLVCAKLAAPGQVTSYEANSTLAPLMRENFSLNGLTPHLISKAVTELGGQIHFF